MAYKFGYDNIERDLELEKIDKTPINTTPMTLRSRAIFVYLMTWFRNTQSLI